MRHLAMIGLLALAGCTASAEMQASERATAERDLAKALAGRVAGKPQDCIPAQGVNGPQVISRSVVLYEDGRRVYRNDLAAACPSLSQYDTLVIELHGTEICRNDVFRTLDAGASIPSGYCRFGSFTPYTKQ